MNPEYFILEARTTVAFPRSALDPSVYHKIFPFLSEYAELADYSIHFSYEVSSAMVLPREQLRRS